MKKTSLFLMIAISALVFLSGCVSEEYIKAEIERANYCETADDCMMAHSKCPFGCYPLVNKNEVERINSLIDSYPLRECLYKCEPRPEELACVEGKCVKKETPVEPTEPTDDEVKACDVDSECVEVKGDCCGCSMGGVNIVINEKYMEYWNGKLQEECAEPMACIALYNCNDAAEPECFNGNCRLAEKIEKLEYEVVGCAKERTEEVPRGYGEAEESITFEVIDDYVLAEHFANHACCLTMQLNQEIIGSQINVTEMLYGEACRCICSSVITATIGPLDAGSYTVNVYTWTETYDQTDLVETETVVIE